MLTHTYDICELRENYLNKLALTGKAFRPYYRCVYMAMKPIY